MRAVALGGEALPAEAQARSLIPRPVVSFPRKGLSQSALPYRRSVPTVSSTRGAGLGGGGGELIALGDRGARAMWTENAAPGVGGSGQLLQPPPFAPTVAEADVGRREGADLQAGQEGPDAIPDR